MNYDEAKHLVLNHVSPHVGERWVDRNGNVCEVTLVTANYVYWGFSDRVWSCMSPSKTWQDRMVQLRYEAESSWSAQQQAHELR